MAAPALDDDLRFGEIKETDPDADLGGDWTHALAFYCHGDFKERYAANVVVAAYAMAAGGVFFDLQKGAVSSDADNLKNIMLHKSQLG